MMTRLSDGGGAADAQNSKASRDNRRSVPFPSPPLHILAGAARAGLVPPRAELTIVANNMTQAEPAMQETNLFRRIAARTPSRFHVP
jgi:hypothetical protein